MAGAGGSPSDHVDADACELSAQRRGGSGQRPPVRRRLRLAVDPERLALLPRLLTASRHSVGAGFGVTVACWPFDQRTTRAGTRRVHQFGHARASAGRADTARGLDLQEKHGRECPGVDAIAAPDLHGRGGRRFEPVRGLLRSPAIRRVSFFFRATRSGADRTRVARASARAFRIACSAEIRSAPSSSSKTCPYVSAPSSRSVPPAVRPRRSTAPPRSGGIRMNVAGRTASRTVRRERVPRGRDPARGADHPPRRRPATRC